MNLIAMTVVLWRAGHGVFSLTGWGFLILLIILGGIGEGVRRQ